MSSKPHQRNLPVPFFSQREVNYRWQRRAEGDAQNDVGVAGEFVNNNFYPEGARIPSTEISLAWTTCNIVSLCMILHYYGITDDSPDEMPQRFIARTLLTRRNP